MKKLWIIAVAAMLVTACAKESDVYDKGVSKNEIGFSGVNYGLTRNTPADGSTFATANKMYVSAVYNRSTSAYETYFANETYADGNSDGVWTGVENTYYYPFSGTMDFYAYSAASKLAADNKWQLNANRTVEIDGTALDGKDDVMYSNALNVTCGSTVEAQTLKFNHALAWLRIKFVTKDANTPNDAIKINRVEISNVLLKGKLNVDYKTPANTGWDTTEQSAEGFEFAAPAGDFTVNSTPQDWNTTGALVIPQTVGSSTNTVITITYQMKKGTNAWYEPTTYSTNALSATWLAGKKYTYTFEIGLSEITFKGEVAQFTDGTM